MTKRNVLTCMLLLTNVCYAAAVKSNGTGGGKWSAPGTWAGGVVPANGDSVTIAAGDTVTFDVDMASWPNGIAGLTCAGTMNCSTSAGTYHLKTSADIGGIGTINCGWPQAVYPPNCTMTFNFDAKPNSFECGAGLILNLRCTEPSHPVIALSGAEAVEETELSVDADVRGDIWVPGKTIRIDDISGTVPDSEVCVIAPGGVAATTIRVVDPGLVNAKALGAKVILIARNIRIIGSTDYPVKSMTGGVLDCEISSCAQGVTSCSNCKISGTISGCTYGVFSTSGSTISGVISGCNNGVTALSGSMISGTISGCTYGVADGSGDAISGLVSGCNCGIYYGSDCMISGAILGCNSGVYAASAAIQDAMFGGNTYDLRRVVSVFACDTVFGSTTENYEYDTDKVPPWAYVASYNHDGVPGAFKAWTRGGVIESDVNVVPPGYGTSYRHSCRSSVIPCFRQEATTVEPHHTLRVEGKILILDNHSAWAPRLELIDASADPLVDASKVALASGVIPSPLGRYYWQDVAVSFTNTGPIGRRVWIRCSAQRSNSDVYEVWSAELEKAASP